MCVTMSTKYSVVTKFYLKTGHLSNEQVIAFFYGRFKIECLEERILVFMVYMFIKPLSKEKKELQCRFDFFDFVFIGSNSRPVISLCSNRKTRTSLLNVVSHDAIHSRMKANNPFHVDFCVIWYFPDKQLQDVRLLLFFILPADPAGP